MKKTIVINCNIRAIMNHSGYQNLSISVYKKSSEKILSITLVPNVWLVLLLGSCESLKMLMFVYLFIVSPLNSATPMYGNALMYIDSSRIL